MLFILIVLAVLAIIFGPQIWAQYVLAHYAKPREEIPGTGGEFAAHLVNQANLAGVNVEATALGDHYDPGDKTVRLSEANYAGKSLTAVVVAAHEVGHAIQDHIGYAPLKARTRLIKIASFAERIGAMILIALPFIAVLTRVPAAGALMLIAGFAVMVIPIVVHMITIPVEFDASFKRAMPILESGYVPADELPAARRILRACALTYVAASLATLLNFWRWISILRR